MRLGASDGSDIAALSHAFAGVAETGTLVLISGADNPTTLNFLPDVHVVVVGTADIASDFETVMVRLRERFGTGALPRAVNMITGPSRSADIEQTLILGAHGPRKLHVIVFGGPDDKPMSASPGMRNPSPAVADRSAPEAPSFKQTVIFMALA